MKHCAQVYFLRKVFILGYYKLFITIISAFLNDVKVAQLVRALVS